MVLVQGTLVFNTFLLAVLFVFSIGCKRRLVFSSFSFCFKCCDSIISISGVSVGILVRPSRLTCFSVRRTLGVLWHTLGSGLSSVSGTNSSNFVCRLSTASFITCGEAIGAAIGVAIGGAIGVAIGGAIAVAIGVAPSLSKMVASKMNEQLVYQKIKIVIATFYLVGLWHLQERSELQEWCPCVTDIFQFLQIRKWY